MICFCCLWPIKKIVNKVYVTNPTSFFLLDTGEQILIIFPENFTFETVSLCKFGPDNKRRYQNRIFISNFHFSLFCTIRKCKYVQEMLARGRMWWGVGCNVMVMAWGATNQGILQNGFMLVLLGIFRTNILHSLVCKKFTTWLKKGET